jgi:uncharacterized protein YrrD
MRKGKNVIGKDLLSIVDGKKVGTVKDLLFGSANDSVAAILVEKGGILRSPRIAMWENVRSVGKDAVMISESAAIMAADSHPLAKEILRQDDELMGKKVFTDGGDQQGSISDVYFNERSGQILGFEVSGGLVENIHKGASYLPREDVINFGPEVVLVKSEVADELESQAGGVRGALDSARAKVIKAVDITRHKAGESLGATKMRVGEAASDLKGRAEDAAVGKRAGSDVEADDGSIIVAKGQRIGQQHIEQARFAGKLPVLLGATGLGRTQDTGKKAGATFGGSGDKVGRAVQDAEEKAGSLWDDFTRKLSEMTDSAGKRMDEKKLKKRLADIQEAIGRPVTKVILDRRDDVVLNLGDIITHEAVQRAHDAGMLDTLLNNVYKGTVEFGKQDMMAPSQAQATVQNASGTAPIIEEIEQEVERAPRERQQHKQQAHEQAEAERQARKEYRRQISKQREVEDNKERAASQEQHGSRRGTEPTPGGGT